MNTHEKKLARSELAKQIHQKAGRLNCPATKAFKDKKKYNRKTKHKGVHYHESPFSLQASFIKPLSSPL